MFDDPVFGRGYARPVHGIAALLLAASQQKLTPHEIKQYCDECTPPGATGLIIGVATLAVVLMLIPLAGRTLRRRRERPARLARVRSEEAARALSDAGFAVHEVRSDAGELFHAVQAAWDAQDDQRLAELVDADQLARWNLARPAREELWASPVRVDGGVDVEFVEPVEAGPGGAQRVLVRFQAPLDGWAPPGAAGQRPRPRAPQ
jgi:hypothetical protein